LVVNENRFLFDGKLPQISSKYRRESADIALAKGSARFSDRKQSHERQYDVNFDLVSPKLQVVNLRKEAPPKGEEDSLEVLR
jgi:hypothetical protein